MNDRLQKPTQQSPSFSFTKKDLPGARSKRDFSLKSSTKWQSIQQQKQLKSEDDSSSKEPIEENGVGKFTQKDLPGARSQRDFSLKSSTTWQSIQQQKQEDNSKSSAQEESTVLEEALAEISENKERESTVQMKCATCETEEIQMQATEASDKSDNSDDVQLKTSHQFQQQQESIQQIAAEGFSGGATALPHKDTIQKSFGTDLSHVQAYIGGAAADACEGIGALAYASGNQIAFKEQPNLELVAHEAAHTVQQASGGVQLDGGFGKMGDKYEQHADEVAASVAAGKSAAPLLAEYTKSAPVPVQAMSNNVVQGECIQCKEDSPVMRKEAVGTSSILHSAEALAGENQDKSGQLEQQSETLYAIDYSVRPPNGDPDRPCFDLLEAIEQLANELKQRYDDMLADQHNLFHLRRFKSDPRLRGDPDPGSWEGHQEFYNKKRKELAKKLRDFEKNPKCDDDNDPDGYGVRASYDLALEYVQTEPPAQPLPRQQFTLPDWAVEAGARIVDGVLVIPKVIWEVDKFYFGLLVALARAFGAAWRFAN